MKPPFKITPAILARHSEITGWCGKLEGWNLPLPKPEFRRRNQVRSIQGSLAIEGNSLSIEQVTALLEGKRVLGPSRDILEAQNAMKAYAGLAGYQAYSEKSFLKAHGILMQGLMDDPGRWRHGSVGIRKGSQIVHVAPPAKMVPRLIKDLFGYLRSDKETSLLIRSCVFHYETAFIHPFLNGNGRMARLWQTVLLMRHHPVFAYVPIESVLQAKRKEYYRTIEASNKKGESTPFVEFMLAVIAGALGEYAREAEVPAQTAQSRLRSARERFRRESFTRKDYLRHCKTISTATASRDLREGVVAGMLLKTGDKRKAEYRFRPG